MAKKYDGVIPRGNGLQVSMTIEYHGRKHRLREMMKLAPTQANMAAAARIRADLIEASELRRFTLDLYAQQFPDSEWLRKMRKGDNRQTVDAVIRDWLDFVDKRGRLSHTTLRGYRTHANQWCEYFQGRYFDQITAAVLDEWVAERQATGTRVKTLKSGLSVLHMAWAWARKKETTSAPLPFDDMDEIVPTKEQELADSSEEYTRKPDPLTGAEQDTLLEAADGWLYNFCAFNIWAGLRPGEMFALAWEDVDWANERIEVKRRWTEARLSLVNRHKRGRIVPLFPPALAALKAQKERTFMLSGVDYGKFGNLRFVFLHPSGEPIKDDQQFRDTIFAHLIRKAGIRYRYPMQLRHTFASNLLSMGVLPKEVANLLGHTTTAMVEKHYGRIIADVLKRSGYSSVDKIKEFLTKQAKVKKHG